MSASATQRRAAPGRLGRPAPAPAPGAQGGDLSSGVGETLLDALELSGQGGQQPENGAGQRVPVGLIQTALQAAPVSGAPSAGGEEARGAEGGEASEGEAATEGGEGGEGGEGEEAAEGADGGAVEVQGGGGGARLQRGAGGRGVGEVSLAPQGPLHGGTPRRVREASGVEAKASKKDQPRNLPEWIAMDLAPKVWKGADSNPLNLGYKAESTLLGDTLGEDYADAGSIGKSAVSGVGSALSGAGLASKGALAASWASLALGNLELLDGAHRAAFDHAAAALAGVAEDPEAGVLAVALLLDSAVLGGRDPTPIVELLPARWAAQVPQAPGLIQPLLDHAAATWAARVGAREG
jgi:hypothetical protein